MIPARAALESAVTSVYQDYDLGCESLKSIMYTSSFLDPEMDQAASPVAALLLGLLSDDGWPRAGCSIVCLSVPDMEVRNGGCCALDKCVHNKASLQMCADPFE